MEIKHIRVDNSEIYWKKVSKVWGDPLHKTCAYNAMFPVRVADYFIRHYSREGDQILDPFSGRGTSLLQGRILKRKSFASDLNPLSYVLSKSKEKTYDKIKVLRRLNKWKKEYFLFDQKEKLLKDMKDKEIMLNYYSSFNLQQIAFLKERIGKNWIKNNEIDNFILSISLGLMHGPAKKNGESSYFSVSMSNGISMSPNYVKKYVKTHNLKYIESDIFEQIRNKIEKVYAKISNELKMTTEEGKFKIANALEISHVWKELSPKLIFTSPPYLNIINYTKQNWIKMWMLGFDTDLDNKLIGLNDKHNKFNYLDNFLIPFMKECFKLMQPNKTFLVLVIGDVVKKNEIYSIQDKIIEIERKTNLKLKEIYIDEINQSYKSTNSMGTKAGRATQIEKIYIFQRVK